MRTRRPVVCVIIKSAIWHHLTDPVTHMYMEGWGEEGGYLLLCFFSIIYILGLVCHKHTIHVCVIQCIVEKCSHVEVSHVEVSVALGSSI